jgi:hypothetical protein
MTEELPTGTSVTRIRLFPSELEIGSDEGFSADKDIFDRKPFGEKLTRIIQGIDAPLVILLDGQWGTGKTTFIKMWLGELSKRNIPAIYFDAFANDYHEDAFLTLAGEIVARAEKLKPERAESVQAFKTSAIKVAKALGRASIRIGIRAASAGLLTGDEIVDGLKIAAEDAKITGDETAKAVDELLKERLESRSTDREVFDQFKTALTELAVALSVEVGGAEPKSDTHSATPRLVFVIDELDRCRPSFALELLEKIKHFFALQGITFILVSSLEQLQSAVRLAYGEINARTYLEKFYHLRLLLPSDMDTPDKRATTRYLQYLFPESDTYRNTIIQFSKIHPLSLRTLERIAAYAKIVHISTSKNNDSFFPAIAPVLCIMKVVNPELYSAARGGNLSFEQVDAFLSLKKWQDENEPLKRHRISEFLEGWWKYALNSDVKPDYHQYLMQYNFREPIRLVTYSCDLIDAFHFP